MEYVTLEKEAYQKLCSLIRESHSVADVIDDENIATNSTYSSKKIDELITELKEDSEETLYTAGIGITISEDKVIATKDIKKNYIDNSNFRINQTGATEYSTPNGYTVDRWYIDGGVLTPVENGVQFVNPNTESGASTLVRLRQNIHYGFSEFAGKTVTLSAKINGVIYSGKATIPTEKPTEGTATQYITAGITDFSINLNYSVTADYFVPYIALAYNRTALIEWMKLEVNDEFSGYIEPDYMTELIKMNFTTSDKGALDIPTSGESYDDTEIKEDITALEASVENKLDKDGNIGSITYTQLTEDFILNSESSNYGELVNIRELTEGKLGDILFLKEIDNKVYVGGQGGFGYFDTNMENYTSIYDISTSGGASNQYRFTDICISKAYEDRYYLTALDNNLPFYYSVESGLLTAMTDLSNGGTSGVYPTCLFEYVSGVNQNKVYAIDTSSLKIQVIEWGGVINSVIDIRTDFNITETFTSRAEYGDTIFMSFGSDILYFDIMNQNWETFKNLSGFSPSAEMQIIKILAKENGVYIFTEDNSIRSNYYNYETCSWETLGGEWNIISVDSSETSFSPSTPIFFNNDKVYCASMSRLYETDLNTGINFKSYGQMIGSSDLPYPYVSYWYYNNKTNKFYVLVQNSLLIILEYATEQQSVENKLQYIQTLENQIQQLMDRVLLLEELQGI